jgi:hypothetical protein
LGVGAVDLLVESLDVRGKQAMELEGVTLIFRESGAFVEIRRLE